MIFTNKHSDCTEFYLNPSHLNRWLHQNDAEYIECLEGCLLDNYVVSTRRGYAMITEHYLNSNSSDYYVLFAPYTHAGVVVSEWNDFEEEYLRSVEETEEIYHELYA